MEENPTTSRPKRGARVQIARTQTADGEEAYVLHNPDADTYLEIDAPNFFLWQLMDGEHELGALAMAYYGQYGVFPFDRLSQLIAQLEANALLEGTLPVAAHSPAGAPASRVARLANTAFQREFSWQRADEFFARFYRRIGWLFFTRSALIAFGLITAIGCACFVYLHWLEDYRLLRINNSYGAGIIVLLLANYIVIFWHESGHGLTCKSFGRHIRKAGIMFYYGIPAFFVDVSDMWLARRGQRILVSLAGPAVNVIIGSILAIIAIMLPPSTAAQVLFVAAFVAYFNGFWNLNPLLELDGYYVLVDWLQTTGLRQRSFAFVKKDLATKIRTGARFSREETAYAIYGVLALGFTALFVLLGVYVWQRELRVMVQRLARGEDVLATVLIGGVAFLASTWLVVGLAARVVVWLRTRKPIPEGGGRGH